MCSGNAAVISKVFVFICLLGMMQTRMAAQKGQSTVYKVTTATELTDTLKRVEHGDTINLASGIYRGNFLINHSIYLTGEGAIIEANSQGNAISIYASNVHLSHLHLQNWGEDLYQHNAGIFIDKGQENIVIEHIVLSGDGFGIYAEEIEHILIQHNQFIGNHQLAILDRGDGIHLKKSENAQILNNQIINVRDGVYLESGGHSVVNYNHFKGLQYAIHYMYTQGDMASQNIATQVLGGYALMSANNIQLIDNQASHASEFGVLLNLTQDSLIKNNDVRHIHWKGGDPTDLFESGKGIFIYGSQGNILQSNLISACDIGVAMALGGELNRVFLNHFINNQTQVRYVGDIRVEWSENQQGNYWSDYQGWDMTGNGIGEQFHLPNDRLDKLFWLYPEAHFLMESPVVILLKRLDKLLIKSDYNGVIDSYPLVSSLDLSIKD